MLASYNGAGVMKQSYEANVASNESLSQSKFLSICLNLHIDASHNTVKLHNHYIPSNSVHYLVHYNVTVCPTGPCHLFRIFRDTVITFI